MEIGLLAALGTLACWTVGTFSFTEASQKAGAIAVNRVRLLLAALLLTLLNLLIGITPTNVAAWGWLAMSGLVGLTIGDHFAFSAYQLMGSSRTSLFATFAPAAALLFGFVLLGEQLNTIGLLGMAVSAAGLLVFLQQQRKEATIIPMPVVMKGSLYAFLGAVCQGAGLVLAKKGMEAGQIGPIQATAMRMIAATIAIYAIGLVRNVDLNAEMRQVMGIKSHRTPVLRGVLFGPVMGVSLSLLAALKLEVAVAQTLLSLLPLSVLGIASLRGKEQPGPAAWWGALLGLAGVMILVWRDQLQP